MKEIQLTQGKVALVDDQDYEWLSRWKWYALNMDGWWYAVRNARLEDGTTALQLMHRVILAAPRGVLVDHKDGDGLNNTRDNIRLASRQQNNQNTRLSSRNTSGYKGVSLDKKSGKWRAAIYVNRKYQSLGYYTTKEEASKAYNEAASSIFGEFAKINPV